MLSSEFKDNPKPLYLKTKHMIIDKIKSGIWPYNFKIPSEADLVKTLSISRMTINRALRELTAEGFLVRIQGVGSFVAKPKAQTALFKIQNISEEIQQRGHQHSSKVISIKKLKLDVQQLSKLNFHNIKTIFHSLIVHYEDDLPVQIEERYINGEIVPYYLTQDFTVITPNQYLNQIAPATEGEHIVEAVLPSQEQCKLLNIQPQDPCLLIYRQTWSNKTLVSSTKLIYPGSRYQLKGKFGL